MTPNCRTVVRQEIPAGATPVLTGALVKEDGSRLAASDLDTLTVTLTDRATGAIVNGRDHQDILGTNGGSVATPGAFRLELVAADTMLLSATETREGRRALIEFTYGDSTRRGFHEVVFGVVKY